MVLLYDRGMLQDFFNEAAQFELPHKIRSANYEKLTLQSTVHITIYITRRYETINKRLIDNKKTVQQIKCHLRSQVRHTRDMLMPLWQHFKISANNHQLKSQIENLCVCLYLIEERNFPTIKEKRKLEINCKHKSV